MKIRPVGAEFNVTGRAVGRTDMTKLIVAFRNFVKAPKNDVLLKIFVDKCYITVVFN
jgi:hypothetical protein